MNSDDALSMLAPAPKLRILEEIRRTAKENGGCRLVISGSPKRRASKPIGIDDSQLREVTVSGLNSTLKTCEPSKDARICDSAAVPDDTTSS